MDYETEVFELPAWLLHDAGIAFGTNELGQVLVPKGYTEIIDKIEGIIHGRRLDYAVHALVNYLNQIRITLFRGLAGLDGGWTRECAHADEWLSALSVEYSMQEKLEQSP